MGTSRLLANHKIAVIGAGNMGRAIIGGLLKGNDADAGQISASRRSERALRVLAEQFPGLNTTSSNVEAVKNATDRHPGCQATEGAEGHQGNQGICFE